MILCTETLKVAEITPHVSPVRTMYSKGGNGVSVGMFVYIFYKVYLNVVGSVQQTVTGTQGKGSDVLNRFSSEFLMQTVCFWTGFLLYLPGMIIISLFINEVNFKTNRQNIIDGWKRKHIFLVKSD